MPELGARVSCNHLGNGKVPLLPLWKGIHIGDRPEAPCVHLQEAHGGNIFKDSEVSGEKLSIPALLCQGQERSGNSTGRCSEYGHPSTHGRRWNTATHFAVNWVTANIPYSSNDLEQIHKETRKDPILKLLIHYIFNGWPCDQRQLLQELHAYWNFREDLSIKDGIATKGSRLLVPSTL